MNTICRRRPRGKRERERNARRDRSTDIQRQIHEHVQADRQTDRQTSNVVDMKGIVDQGGQERLLAEGERRMTSGSFT